MLPDNKEISPGCEDGLTDKLKSKKIRRSKIILQVLGTKEIARSQKCMFYIINM